FENSPSYQAVLISEDPDFKNPENNDLRIGEESAANETALPVSATNVPLDILGVSRGNNPDMGAYQSIIFEDTAQ
ncbi:MAG: hypothetical protein WA951_05665, partial [Leeuwenhoekiella sp.]